VSQKVNAALKASYAALPFAVVALITAIALTLLVSWTTKRPRHRKSDSAGHNRLLVNFWLFGHLVFAVAMLATVYVRTIEQGTVLVATIGIPWTLTSCVPFAIIGKEVAQSRRAGTLTSLHNATTSAPQILAAVMCAILFLIGRSVGRCEDTVWSLWMAGCAAIVAMWKTSQLRTLLVR
jgi:solute carrier family 45 protein 1/2/4